MINVIVGVAMHAMLRELERDKVDESRPLIPAPFVSVSITQH